jgi:hypothetical protein
MYVARLLVERGTVRFQSQDWGDYTFLSAPSPGDRIACEYDGGMHYLTVISVHHKPVSAPAHAAGTAPSAEVVAKWTSAD